MYRASVTSSVNQHRFGLRSACGFLLLLMVLMLLFPGRASAQQRNIELCAVAAGLINDALPGRALALIETTRDARSRLGQTGAESPCVEEGKAASKRIEESTRKTAEATRYLGLRMWSEAAAEAKSALSLDSENQAASDAAAQARDQKSALQTMQDKWKTIVERQVEPLTSLLLPFTVVLALLVVLARLLVLLVGRWPLADTNGRDVRPRILSAGIAGLISSAALFSFGLSSVGAGSALPLLFVASLPIILAVLSALLAVYTLVGTYAKDGKSDGQKARDSLRRAVWVLLIVTLAAAMSVLIKAAGTLLPLSEELLILLLATVTGLLGAMLCAWWLATRLRLEVSVADLEGTDKLGDVGLVVAMLNELGAQKPRGIEVPRGADVTALNGALLPLPENPLINIVKKVLEALLGAVPWHARIEGKANLLSVSIHRNGRTVSSAVIDKQLLGVAPVTPDQTESPVLLSDAPLRLASAFILATLAREHSSISEGLAGASEWRSIGLQYIATTAPDDFDPIYRRRILGLALNYDPKNKGAQLAFRHAHDRMSTDIGTLVKYREWLKSFEDTLDPRVLSEAALRLRACYTRSSVAINAVFASRNPSGDRQEVASVSASIAESAYRDLEALLKSLAERGEELGHIFDQISSDSDDLRLMMGDTSGIAPRAQSISAPRLGSSPARLYNLACYHASRLQWEILTKKSSRNATLEEITKDDTEAVRLLQRAIIQPPLASWMREDPQLDGLRRRLPYKQAFLAEPRSDFYLLTPVKPHSERLRAAGLGQIEILATLSPDSEVLALAIPADAVIRASIVELARLRSSFTPELEKESWALEMLEHLTAKGVANKRSLVSLRVKQRTSLVELLAKKLVADFKPQKDHNKRSKRDLDERLSDEIEDIVNHWISTLSTPASSHSREQD